MSLIFGRMNRKGALFIEYALVLAFILGIGVFFIGNSGIADAISDIFGNSETALATAVNGRKPVKNMFGETGGILSEEWLKDRQNISMIVDGKLSSVWWNNNYSDLDDKQRAFVNAVAEELGLDPENITVIKRGGQSAWDEYNNRWFTTSVDIYTGSKLTEAELGKHLPMVTYTYGYYGSSNDKSKTQLISVEKYEGWIRKPTSGDTYDTGRKIESVNYIYGDNYKNYVKGDILKEQFANGTFVP